VTAPSVIAPVIPQSSACPRGTRDGLAPLPRQPLPLPNLPPHRTSAVVYGASAVDDRGRVTERAVLRALDWPPRHRLTIHAAGGTLTVTPDPAGEHRVTGRGYPRIPAELRLRCGLAIGERVVLAGGPDRFRLVIYPPAALDLALARTSATANDGDPA
jgi:hypothetical protein